MIKKQHILIITLIFCISLFIITNWSSFNKKQNQVKNITDTPLSNNLNNDVLNSKDNTRLSLCETIRFTDPSIEEIEYTKAIKNDPFVQYLKFTLNKFADNDYSVLDESGSLPGLFLNQHFEDTAYSDLEKYNNEMLKGEFIILETDIAVGGGSSIILMFKDYPDKIYYAWIYRDKDEKNNDYFDLRAFNEYNQSQNIEDVQKIFINQLCSDTLESNNTPLTYKEVINSKIEETEYYSYYKSKYEGQEIQWQAKISGYYSQITGIKFCIIDKDHTEIDINKPCDWFWANSEETKDADIISINPDWDGLWVNYILNYYKVAFNKNSNFYNDIYTIQGKINGIDCLAGDRCIPDIEIINIIK